MKKLIFLFLSLFLTVFLASSSVLAQVGPASDVGPSARSNNIFPRRLAMPYLGEVYFETGEKIELDQDVMSDAYLAGGSVKVDGRVRGDLLVAGGEVVIDGEIDQDLRVIGGEVHLKGLVGRNVTMVGGRLVVDDQAQIAGSLVAAGGEINVSDQAQIIGRKYIRTAPRDDMEKARSVGMEPIKQFFGVMATVVSVVKWLSTLVMGLLLVALFPKTLAKMNANASKKVSKYLIWGLVASIVLPVIAVLSMFTIIGLPLGLMLMAVLAIGWYLAKLIAMVAAGHFILSKANGRRLKVFEKAPSLYTSLLLGVVLFLILGYVPFLGWLAKLFLIWIGFGLLVHEKLAFYKRVEK